MPSEPWVRVLPQGATVSLLPGRGEPRLLLLSKDAGGRWADSAMYPASTLRGRALRSALRVAAAAYTLPRTTVNDPEAGLLIPQMEELFPTSCPDLVFVGPPGPARKCSLRMRGRDGLITGYVKASSAAGGIARLRREYEVLSGLPVGVGPIPLGFIASEFGAVLGLEPVSGRPGRGVLRPPRGLLEVLGGLVGAETVPGSLHPWLERLATRPGSHEIEAALDILRAGEWPVVITHGDAAPWNVFVAGGQVRLLDWEYGTLNGFQHADAVEYILQVACLVKKWSPARAAHQAARWLEDGSGMVLSGGVASSLVKVTAFCAYSEALEDGAAPSYPLQHWRSQVWRNTR
jgi:hypothetical protein